MLKKLLFPVMVKGIPLNNKTTRQQNNQKQTTRNKQPDNKITRQQNNTQPTTYLYIFLFIDISFLNQTTNILFISKILGNVDFLYYLCVRITIRSNLLTE